MSERLPISLIVITLNEEKNLGRCLRAADFCAEMIVVDSGSSDRTLEIAAEYQARVFHRPWTGYGDQKNFGAAQSSHDWVLCIDADEVISPELRAAIVAAFRAPPHVDAFDINRHSYYAGTLINHGGWYPQWRTFLYRKDKAYWGGAEPHTVVHFTGERKSRLAGDLYHYTYDSIRQHIQKNVAAAHAAAAAMAAQNRRAKPGDFLARTPWAFLRGYIFQRGFLDGFYGLIIAVSGAYYTFAKYAMLAEMNRKRKAGARRGDAHGA